MQQSSQDTALTVDETVSPALGMRGIQNEGGFLTPYYLFDLMERQYGDELDPIGREENRNSLKRAFQQAQRALIDLVGTQISFGRTWTLWYKELFQVLGFSSLQKLDEPLETARYGMVPISHAYYSDSNTDTNPLVLIDLHPFGTDLDRHSYSNPDHNPLLTTEPISRALEFVLDFNQTRWALLSNGLEIRLYRRGGSVARQYLKVDFVSLFERGDSKEWLVFWGLFRLAAFTSSPSEQTTGGSNITSCLLDKVIDASHRHATKIADDLRDNIVHAVENLLQGVIDAPSNRHFWEATLDAKKVPNEDQLKRLFEESIYLLYRLLFILYAESRDLLPIGESRIYRESYSLEHLRTLAEKQLKPEDYDKTYYIETLRTLFTMLYKGYPFRNPGAGDSSRPKGTSAFRIPPYNGRLFDPNRTKLLDQCHVPDKAMREVIRELSLSHPKYYNDRRERYSYADLGVDQLGSIYEGLLVYEPFIAEQTMVEAQLKGDIRLIPLEQADELELPHNESSKKPAGSFLLRIWGGRRKGSGSYYTPQAITTFLVKDVLSSLVEPIIEGCAQRDDAGKPLRRADEILKLKVCDPAMGSGAFLVQACRYLGDAYGRAIIAEEQRENKRISAAELARYKRRIAETCIYGVDTNALAVELAKVSLWLETLAQDRPLTFLDAHLRHGNSLIGAPLRDHEGKFDPFTISILPVEAFSKAAKVDSKSYGRLLDRLKTENGKQVRQLKAGQKTLFTGDEEQQALAEYERQRIQLEESDEDKSLEEAVALVHHKQELLQAALSGDESKIRHFKQLCDLWCAVWFWPLDATLLPPTTVLYRDLAAIILKHPKSPDQYVPENAGEYLTFSQRIAHEQHFFHWELEFPEVWCDYNGNLQPEGGFDAIIGNPPWSKVAPNSKEFWSNYLPTFRTLGKQDAARAANEHRHNDPNSDTQWRQYFKHIKQQSSLYKQGGIFIWQGKGQINTYKLFVEQMLRLTRVNGICSLVLPASLYTDKGSTTLRRLLFFQQQNRFVLSLENRGGIFPIDSRQKFVLLSDQKTHNMVIRKHPQEQVWNAQTVNCLFLIGKDDAEHDLAPTPEGFGLLVPQLDRRLLHLPTKIIEILAPDTYSLMEFKSQREIDLVTHIYGTFPRLGKILKDAWNVSFKREMDMTNDSHLFREGTRLHQFGAAEQRGRMWRTPPEAWYDERPGPYVLAERVVDSSGDLYFPNELDTDQVSYTHKGYLLTKESNKRQVLPIAADEAYVPLYEGRMVHQFDHTAKAYIRGSGRSAEWRTLDFNLKEIIPHYFVAQQDIPRFGFRAGFCDVTGQTNERSLLTAIIPSSFPCGNTVPTVSITPHEVNIHLLWVALTNAFVVDWLIRLRMSNHINFFILESIALPRPKIGSQEAQALIHATLRLTCTTPEFAELWRAIIGEDWQETSGETDMRGRAHLRAKIDAVVADLYGLSEHDFAYILSTFPLLDRDQPPLLGEKRSFITRDMALLALFQHRGKTPPMDIVTFFSEAGVDISQRTGPIIDLAERVHIATQELGAIAYQPSRRDGDNGIDDDETLDQDELDFDDDDEE